MFAIFGQFVRSEKVVIRRNVSSIGLRLHLKESLVFIAPSKLFKDFGCFCIPVEFVKHLREQCQREDGSEFGRVFTSTERFSQFCFGPLKGSSIDQGFGHTGSFDVLIIASQQKFVYWGWFQRLAEDREDFEVFRQFDPLPAFCHLRNLVR